MTTRTALRNAFPEIAWESLTVLAVDDAPLVRDLMATTFKTMGSTVVTSSSAEDALAVMGNGGVVPDIVVTDLDMPGVGGLGLIRMMKSHPKWRAIPIIVVSGSEDGHLALAAGADRFLMKPYRRKELLAAVSAQFVRRAPSETFGTLRPSQGQNRGKPT